MNDLVFQSDGSVNAALFTTGDVIAKYARIEKKTVNNRINQYRDDLAEFGGLEFSTIKKLNSNGGRPHKVWHLNEQQATLLVTYLDNTAAVRNFKKSLIHQFYAMKEELLARRLAFLSGKDDSKSLNDAIKASNIDMHGHEYSTINNLVYKKALGVNGVQLKKLRDIPKHGNITEYLTVEEAEAVQKAKGQVEALLSLGLPYSDVRGILNRNGVIIQLTIKEPENMV